MGGGGGTKGWNLRANPYQGIIASQSDTFTQYMNAADGMQQIMKEQPQQVASPAKKPANNTQGNTSPDMKNYVDTAKMIQSIVNANQNKEDMTGQTPTVATVEKPVVQGPTT